MDVHVVHRKSDCLGCAVLLCRVICLTLLASFFLPSHLSLKHVWWSYNILSSFLPLSTQHSSIIDLYPTDFKIDLNGKKYAWQGVALLPFVDETRLLRALEEYYLTLTPDEGQTKVLKPLVKYMYTLNRFIFYFCRPIHVHVPFFLLPPSSLLVHVHAFSFILSWWLACSSGVLWDVRFGPSQLSCLGSSVGRALCLEYRVSWVRVPPEAAHFSRKSDCLGCAVLLCLVCLFDLACFFLSSFSSLI